ncbi:hypothetical protein E1218_32355 [Kribbella turkmenica]|uniref:DUF4926 domain-containing protein n=1 Tax=Kribbella turkmenica TaxID=2530375 RepID=A0A4V2YDC4_9ACTN|nr:hypothetical protein [Kribbella turkmenica]TDD14886.1 hypothetical protein E1218_32355 [Kribbella turkmenica]
MTAPALPGIRDRRPEAFDPRTILGLGLPAHVLIHRGDDWTPAWLIGRPHCANGWVALVQYVDADGREQTFRLPADQVAVLPPTGRHH